MLDAMATYPGRRDDLMPCEQRGRTIFKKFMVSSSHYAWCHSDEGDGGGRLTLILHVQPGAKRTEVDRIAWRCAENQARRGTGGRSG